MKNHIPTFESFVNESINEKSNRLGKDLELKDLKIGYPVAIEKHSGIYQTGFIKGIKGNMIAVEVLGGDSGNYKYGDRKLSLPTYGTNFTDENGKSILVESEINEAAARIKPFAKVKVGDTAEVLGSSAKWTVLAKGTGKDYDKILKKFDESGIVKDMKMYPDNYGIEPEDFDEMDFIAVKNKNEIAVYNYDFDGAFVAA